MTGAPEESTYCSRWRSSGRQRKTCSASQSHFGSKNSPETTEADQYSLAFQQLGNKSNSRIFGDNIYRSSNLMESSTTRMPTFERKLEKFALFEDLFQASLIIQNHLTEEGRINYFDSLMRKGALQTIKIVSNPTRENLREMLAVFRGNYVKLQSIATANCRFQKLVFNPANQILAYFPTEFQKLAKDVSWIAAHAIIEQFIHAKMPPCLRKPLNQARVKNSTYVTHLGKYLEMNCLEALDELQVNTRSQHGTNTKADRHRLTCHCCKKTGQYRV